MISRAELETLMRHRAEPAITITLPTEFNDIPPRRTPVRLDGLLRDCERQLTARGEPDEVLAPARALLADDGFWSGRRQGLALFLAPGFSRVIELPRAVEQSIGIGWRFRITALLPFVGERRVAFYLLTVSASRAALFRVDCEGMAPEPVDLPQGTEASAPVEQSLYVSAEDLKKTQLLTYLNTLAAAVKAHIGHLPVPVLLAAQPEVAGNFRKQAELANLWPEHLDVNPDALNFDDLRRRALERMAQQMTEDAQPEIDHFNSLYNDKSPRATTRPGALVRAARWGRMDTLIVAVGRHVWGRFDEQADQIETHGEPLPGDDDLIDLAVVETLLNGGQVKIVESWKIPGDGAAAGIMRY